jgi:hypothetical protein
MTRKFHYSTASLGTVLKYVTTEWQPASDISGWCGLGSSCTRDCLNELVRQGKVVNMWDGFLGIRYYKVTA